MLRDSNGSFIYARALWRNSGSILELEAWGVLARLNKRIATGVSRAMVEMDSEVLYHIIQRNTRQRGKYEAWFRILSRLYILLSLGRTDIVLGK